MNPVYEVIGVMSGTSLDGLDIAFCRFIKKGTRWQYTIIHAETVPYTPDWKVRLASVEGLKAVDLARADADYGHFIGWQVRDFIRRHKIRPGLIASHGHTIFHQPQHAMTLQIGHGAAIAAETGLDVVCDFRTSDVALGGQGAPLVPVGDKLLFGQFTHCLNLGGFANISYGNRGRRIAFDVCPANIVLNRMAAKAGMEFDRGGALAAKGNLNSVLLRNLDRLPYYSSPPPKSLGKEWVLSDFLPLLDSCRIPVKDKLHTLSHHIAGQIAAACGGRRKGTILVTGGGAYNHFLVDLVRMKTHHDVIIPDDPTISFKEALIFAFLGVLRISGEPNALRTVTGARRDSTGGAIYAGTP
jgi:anhydro-N-acetylmuramic acid kinase